MTLAASGGRLPVLPTGGLNPAFCQRSDGSADLVDQFESREEYMADVKVEIRENGPLRVYGTVEIVDVNGNAYTTPEGQWISFCRCGQSGNKPFCDASHRECAFEAESKAR